MRRIWTSTNRHSIEECSRELKKHDIPHSVESEKDSDWGSDSYGTIFFSVWVHDDADIERAKALLEQVSGTPEEEAIPLPNASVHTPLKQFLQLKFPSSMTRKSPLRTRTPLITTLLVLLCLILYGIDVNSREEAPELKAPYSAPFASSSLRQALFFDYPHAFVLEDSLLDAYGPDSLYPEASLPPQGAELKKEFLQTSYWGGLYTVLVEKVTGKEFIPTPSTSVFLLGERIQQGEIWRLVTPAFLHGDIFHLVINLLWIIALGRQIDRKLSSLQYLFLIALIAAISNTAQYFMTGPNFLGISGVVCGMIGYIAARQQIAPWEGYHFTQLLYSLLLFFIWALVAMAGVNFFLEAYLRVEFPISFANTAHVVGLSTGLLLGRMHWFAMAEKRYPQTS